MNESVLLEALTREEVRQIAEQSLAVVPVGATEQHGYHLPLSTDSIIVEEIAKRACEAVRGQFPVYMTPVLAFGHSHHHFPFPALSLRLETLAAVLKDVARSLVVCGFRKMILLNSHGGNEEAIRLVARDISRECQVTVAAASYWTIAREALFKECDMSHLGRFPGHAGSFETSLILALRPELVRKDAFPPRRDDSLPSAAMLSRLFISRPNWMQEINGYSDDARHASEEAGKTYLAIIVREVAKALADLAHAT
ncbi:creatininase family protein [Brevibacillus marinus]|uniref:creatininase family protein n=1 Tax=Brevibacillus marinus TaxID=2496837 RepID=UPI000F823256|nr:creatininase family protein [Brevibacillus marinus]